MPRKQAILRITPCAFCVADALGAGRPVIDAESARRATIQQEVDVVLVVNESACLRVEHHRVTNRRLVDADVVVEEDAHIARLSEDVGHNDAAKIDGAPVVDGVVANDFDAESLVAQPHFRHHRVGFVAKVARPTW